MPMDENQERHRRSSKFIRSLNTEQSSYVTFINNAPRVVSLYWINYQGRAVCYGDLPPGASMNIATYITHPWIVIDKETMDRYTLNQAEVFFPGPNVVKSVRVGENYVLTREGTLVYITRPFYTLRELCLRTIKKYLTNNRQAFLLDIPRSLQYELFAMLPRSENDGNDANRNS